jgi:hypothetical protein
MPELLVNFRPDRLGPSTLPDLGQFLGEGIRAFKKR